ncbi:TPR-like protein [Mycena alexandri]|uniref:TPR-like protein n=1 Tax=Mycena alexandri TaxID=1745969 RepID=A0AAD6T142_9AGAR|nr:TPR-like protein [Mycena alexandri]
MSVRHRERLVEPPHPHNNGPPPPPLQNGGPHPQTIVSPIQGPAANGVNSATSSAIHKLTTANEQTWLLIGRVAEQMGDLEHALSAYENALRHNPMSLSGLTQVAGIARIKENYPKAVEFFQRVLGLQEENGEVWSALGHCYLMQDDLQKAYSAYQQALYLLPNPKEDPKLWYGIGILYDRYGSLDHAEEAFSSVLRMDKDLDFDKANEILFRLGIIYKQQGKYEESLQCFDRILRNPPSPLAHADIWFQIGHVYEQQKDHVSAKDAYERVVNDNPSHAKVLQQLGWLYHQDGSTFQNQDLAIQYLTKSLEADPSDAQSWYLLGRAYMAGQKYNKAYEAYQQAVYRDGRNPTFWCSIGVLYFQINQYRDALDAYSRAIRINPYISEVWFDLGSLYESCNNQISDAIDAYARASELDPNNPVISQRLALLKNAQATGGQVPAAPGPQDVHPTAYASAVVPPPGLTGPPLLLQSTNQRPVFRTDSRGPPTEISLPPPSQVGAGRSSPGPFRGGPPPPVILDESRHPPSHTPLAPMEVDRPPTHGRDYPPSSSREPSSSRGPIGHQSLLLHHPIPQQQIPAEEIRNGGHLHHQESYFTRHRPTSASMSPPPHASRIRSPPPPPFQSYPPSSSSSRGQPGGPGQPPQRSPRTFPAHEQIRTGEPPEMGWERRAPPAEHGRDWPPREHEPRRPRHSNSNSDYPSHAPAQQPPGPGFYPPRSPGPHRGRSPPESSPRSAHPGHPPPSRYWDPKPPTALPSIVQAPQHGRPSPPTAHAEHSRRYDPRYDVRERDHRDSYESERSESRGYPGSHAGSPEGLRNPARPPPPPHMVSNSARSESPHPSSSGPDPKRRRMAKDSEAAAVQQAQPPQEPPKKERKKRSKRKEDGGADTPKPFAGPSSHQATTSYKVSPGYPKGPSSPGPVSSNGSGSSGRSVQPSPTSAAPRMPSRVVDDDYDEPGVADALMGLASYREMPAPSMEGTSHSPTVSSGSRHSDRERERERPMPSHRDSVSSTRSRASPPTSLKRPLSPSDDGSDNKRSRVEVLHRREPSVGRRTPIPSTRPSPIPFRTQPASHSPETRDPYPASPPLPAVFPPHPRPVGAAGLASSVHISNISPIALPPIATLSPASTAASPGPSSERDRERDREREQRERERERERERDDKMQVDSNHSASPPPRTKVEAVHMRTPPKHSPSPPNEMKDSAP